MTVWAIEPWINPEKQYSPEVRRLQHMDGAIERDPNQGSNSSSDGINEYQIWTSSISQSS